MRCSTDVIGLNSTLHMSSRLLLRYVYFLWLLHLLSIGLIRVLDTRTYKLLDLEPYTQCTKPADFAKHARVYCNERKYGL